MKRKNENEKEREKIAIKMLDIRGFNPYWKVGECACGKYKGIIPDEFNGLCDRCGCPIFEEDFHELEKIIKERKIKDEKMQKEYLQYDRWFQEEIEEKGEVLIQTENFSVKIRRERPYTGQTLLTGIMGENPRLSIPEPIQNYYFDVFYQDKKILENKKIGLYTLLHGEDPSVIAVEDFPKGWANFEFSRSEKILHLVFPDMVMYINKEGKNLIED